MKTISLAILLFISLNVHAQKAYEEIIYTGKVATFSVKFSFGYGYNSASTLKVINSKTKKALKFQCDGNAEDDKLRFSRFINGEPIDDYFIFSDIKDEYTFGILPVKINGSCLINGMAYKVILTKKQ